MISVKVLGEWITLDTLNGRYRLDDLFKEVGSPDGKDPVTFARKHGPHSSFSIQVKKYVWATQSKVYGYAGFIDPDFKATMEKATQSGDLALAATIATGVQHK